MLHHRHVRSTLLVAAAALIIAVGSIATLRAVAPTAPSNLAANVSGLNVTLTWGASANAPTQYILQAGFAPGQTAITVPLAGSHDVLQRLGRRRHLLRPRRRGERGRHERAVERGHGRAHERAAPRRARRSTCAR